jgi:8-oxo-dGTP pyrophosphatase MutT (NUDIX family)
MRERSTVRVLLLGPDKRILLIRFHDERLNSATVFWATVGGGIDPGESVPDAALREIREETGLIDVTLGPVVWRDEVVIIIDREPVYFRETYIVAFAKTAALSFEGWTNLEREVIKEMRWFTVPEIMAATEQVYPETLAEWLPDILAGRYPSEPRWLPREPLEREAPIPTDLE